MKKRMFFPDAFRTVLVVFSLFMLAACGGSSGKAYVGTWTANEGTVQLVLSASAFELSGVKTGEMLPESKGTIKVKGREMEQTITHLYIAYEGKDPQDQPGWYNYDEYVAMGQRNGFTEAAVKKMADAVYKTHSSSFSVSPDNQTLSLGVSDYQRVPEE